jgi:hypothetical protein
VALATTLLHLNSDFALLFDAHLGWHVLCVFARGERRVGVIMSATLALQP